MWSITALINIDQLKTANQLVYMCWYGDDSIFATVFHFLVTLLSTSLLCVSYWWPNPSNPQCQLSIILSILLISKRFEHLKSCLGYRIMQSKLCLTYCQPFSDLNGFTVYNARSKTSKFLSHRLSSDKHNIKGGIMEPKNLWFQIWI